MRQINPTNNNGSIQLKFSVSGKRYSFNPIPGSSFGDRRDMATAQSICTRIGNDILSGHFDTTLDRYRVVPKALPKATPKAKVSLLQLWDSWVDQLDISEANKNDHY